MTDRLFVRFRLDQAELRYYNGTAWTTYTDTGVDTAAGTKYSVRVEADGANVKVWRSAGSGLETLLFNRTDMPAYNGNRLQFVVPADTVASLDDLMILADDSGLNRTTTFTPASNNELASASDYNGSTTYAYDALGRMSTETKNSVTKTYSWTMANLLQSVNSSDSAEIDVAYTYTGDLKRIFRFENSTLKNTYQYGAGFDVVAEGSWNGSTPIGQKTFADGLAEVDVWSTPAYSYLTQDHLGSTRGLWDGSINQTGLWEYTPYGAPYRSAGPSSVTHLYTGHDLDRVTGNYFAPFRTLNPQMGRWLSRDPLGMINGPNMYGYVAGNPINHVDPLGLGLLNWWLDNVSGPVGEGIYNAVCFFFCTSDPYASASVPFFGGHNRVTPRVDFGPVAEHMITEGALHIGRSGFGVAFGLPAEVAGNPGAAAGLINAGYQVCLINEYSDPEDADSIASDTGLR